MPGAYLVCLQTGDSGRDATHLYRNPDLLGHVYVGSYLVESREHSFIAADRAGVAGYTFAVEDTGAFEKWQDQHWWPALREQYPLSTLENDGVKPVAITSSDEALIRLLHNPEKTPEFLALEYPAHAHIDLLPRVHGQGLGRSLIDLILQRLTQRRVRGLHFCVSAENHNALAFYRHLGFEVLRDDKDVVYMGVTLP